MEKTGKKIFDRLRNIQISAQRSEIADLKEILSAKNFAYAEISRHGFPYQPTCLSYDPVQKLLAVGSQCGNIRIFGRPGVDLVVKHDSGASVLKMQFLINEGAFITLCSDNCIHLWHFDGKKPEIVHSLRFQREKLTTMHLPFQSKWLYMGTDRGNVHVAAVETFTLSGYVINWNKAIDLSQKTHPGYVSHLSDCPTDESKLLIGFERGNIVLWDLKNRVVEARFLCEQGLKCIAWHFEGKQFICGHSNGSLTTWSIKKPGEPLQCVFPHARASPGSPDDADSNARRVVAGSTASSRRQKFRPITCLDWKRQSNGDDLLLFAGGTPFPSSATVCDLPPPAGGVVGSTAMTSSSPSDVGNQPSVTVLRGKSIAVLEMSRRVVDVVALCDSPFAYDDSRDVAALAVLTLGDLAVVDLASPGYPCFENPNAMDIHESPVTACLYIADCLPDLIPALYSAGSKQKKRSHNDKPWPLKGGECADCPFSYSELIITGHADGSIKFWDSSSTNLQALYKAKTAKFFERHNCQPNPIDDGACSDSDLLAIEHIDFCQDSRQLAVAGQSGHVVLFKFDRQDINTEISAIEIAIPLDTYAAEEAKEPKNVENAASSFDGSDPHQLCGGNRANSLRRAEFKAQNSATSLGSDSSQNSDNDPKTVLPLKAKGGPIKQAAGFQAEFICLTMRYAGHGAELVTALSLNSAYNLLAYATERGLAVVDVCQQVCILAMATGDLYGGNVSAEPPCTPMPSASQIRPGPRSAYERATTTSDHFEFQPNSPLSDTKSTSTSAGSSLDVAQAHSLTRQSAVFGFAPPSSGGGGALTPTASLGGAQRSPLPSAMASSTAPKENSVRSRSPSCSSLDNLTSSVDYVRCLLFLDTFLSKKYESLSGPTLWVGTSQGTVLALNLRINFETRLEQLASALPTGIIINSDCGPLLKLAFIDQNNDLLLPPADSWRDSAKSGERKIRNRLACKTRAGPASPIMANYGSPPAVAAATSLDGSGSTPTAAVGPPSSFDPAAASSVGGQLLVAVGERGVKVYAVQAPGKALATLADHSSSPAFWPLSSAFVVTVQDASTGSLAPPVVAALTRLGRLVVFAAPSLKLLSDCHSFDQRESSRIGETMQISQKGQGMFMCSPSEIQKFTILAETAVLIQSGACLPNLFQTIGAPEPPKQNFFKEIFVGSSNKSLDREELFGESSGKTAKSVATRIPGPSNVDQLRAQGSGAAGDVARARLALNERGEKLGDVEERTAQMMESTKSYADHAQVLLNKYKKKKWYQL